MGLNGLGCHDFSNRVSMCFFNTSYNRLRSDQKVAYYVTLPLLIFSIGSIIAACLTTPPLNYIFWVTAAVGIIMELGLFVSCRSHGVVQNRDSQQENHERYQQYRTILSRIRNAGHQLISDAMHNRVIDQAEYQRIEQYIQQLYHLDADNPRIQQENLNFSVATWVSIITTIKNAEIIFSPLLNQLSRWQNQISTEIQSGPQRQQAHNWLNNTLISSIKFLKRSYLSRSPDNPHLSLIQNDASAMQCIQKFTDIVNECFSIYIYHQRCIDLNCIDHANTQDIIQRWSNLSQRIAIWNNRFSSTIARHSFTRIADFLNVIARQSDQAANSLMAIEEDILRDQHENDIADGNVSLHSYS